MRCIELNNDDEPPLKKKNKGDADKCCTKKSEGDQIPFIYTQPPFTGARKKHPIDRENGLFRPQINPNKT